MMEEISQDDARSFLGHLHDNTPPMRISPIFVKTRAAMEVVDRVNRILGELSSQERSFLVISATRGTGKTAVIQYLQECLQDEVFFIHRERFPSSAESLFRDFFKGIEKQVILDAIQDLSLDPLEVHRKLSQRGHNGTAIALAGLLENNIDSWNWLYSSSPSLPRLKCGLKLVKNVRDEDALDALATITQLLAEKKPIIFAIDELENAYNGLTSRQKEKLRSLLVELINHKRFSRILFIFAATDNVYEECFLSPEADKGGLTRRVTNATVFLSLPSKEEARRIFERILHLYYCAYDISFSEMEIKQIREEYFRNMMSTIPSDIISHALKKGDEKLEFSVESEDLIEKLGRESARIMKNLGPVELGKKFEEAVGLLIKFIPKSEFHIRGADATAEVKWLTEIIPDLKGSQKFLDWSFRLDSMDCWIEVCRTSKKDSVIPIGKALAVLAKTLYHDGSIGLFITHNFVRYGIGRGAEKILSRFPELEKRVNILNLDEEKFKLLIGILGIEEGDRKHAAQFLFREIKLDQSIENLRSGNHFFC